MTPRRWLIASAIAAAALLLAGRVAADLYSSYAWYDALGATAIWRAKVGTMTLLRVAAWIAASVYTLGHLFTVRQSVVSLVVQRQLGDLEIPESVHGRYLTWAAAALAVVLGGLLALAQDDWTTAFLASSGAAFGEYDNYFGADLGFFVFWLPFEVQLWQWTVLVVLVTTGVVIALYVVTAGIRAEQGALRMSAHARRHLTVIAGILLVLLSWHFRLEMYQRLLHGTGPGGAFGFLDHRVAQHGALILSVAALAAAIVVMIAGVNSVRIAIIATSCVLVLWVAARQLAPAVVARAGGQRDPVVREREYLATQAGYSRRAYGIDRIALGDSSAVYRNLDSALAGTAVWGDAMLRRAVDPRATPDSSSVWIGWRASPHGPIADVVRRDADANGERELWTITSVEAAAADPAGAIVPALDPSGQPGSERLIRKPLVYPDAKGYDVIPDSGLRIVGVPMDSRLSRLAHAWSLQSPRFISGKLAGPRATLVTVRAARDRVQRLTPFFEQGTVVTPLIAGDLVYWSIDLYAASNWYPLSASVQALGREWRYFQHAAVAVVDGASGDVMIVPDEPLGPIGQVWVQRFQSLFTTADALPAGLRDLLPPATDELRVQTAVFGRFGVLTASPEALHLPDTSDGAGLSSPPISTTRDRRAVLASLPLLDSTQRVRGVMVQVGGTARRTAWYPAPTAGPRWPTLVDRMRALDSAGARSPRTHRSELRAIPVDRGMLYLQPVFSLSSDNAPAFSYIGVVAGDTGRRVAAARRDGIPSGDLRGQVQAIYAAMRAALQRNDWIAFGRAMDALSRVAGSPPGGRR